MICRKPFVSGTVAYGCGQCMPCRINRRRVWTHRIMLESMLHGDNSFLTLSYEDEHVPKLENGILTLAPKDLQDFLKRLRYYVAPKQFRFFACGEYGEDRKFQGGVEILGRPHYHLALFGLPSCLNGMTGGGQPLYKGEQFVGCCAVCEMYRKAWGKGFIYSGTLTKDSAQYIGGYVTKKLNKTDIRLQGRYPEFARMSNRPGLGAGFVDNIAESIKSHMLDEILVDVPVALRHGKSLLPLGRYLRRKLRVALDRPVEAPREAIAEIQKKMLPMLVDSIVNSESSLAKEIVKAGEAKYESMVARASIFKERKSL